MTYGTRRFIASLTGPLQKFLSWVKSNLFLVLTPIYLISILMLSYHQLLGLPRGLFPVSLPVKILKVLLPTLILTHLNLLVLITLNISCERH